MVEIKVVPCPEKQIAIKCPFTMTPSRIVIHNTANDATAAQEISYMHRNENEVSFHFAVDDTEIVQGIALDRNAWHAGDGNGKGNREGIGIEICYSESGGERFEKAQKNAAELTAKLLSDYGWGIDRVTKHQDYNGKNCPHRTLSGIGWDGFLALVQSYLKPTASPDKTPEKAPETIPDVVYAAYTAGWLPDVKNYNTENADGYAGITNKPFTGFRAQLSTGTIVYRAHLIDGEYLPWVRNLDAAENGYAGIHGRLIDGIQINLENLPQYAVEYRVSTVGRDYLPWVRDYNEQGGEGYAGIYGRAIDRLQIRIVPR